MFELSLQPLKMHIRSCHLQYSEIYAIEHALWFVINIQTRAESYPLWPSSQNWVSAVSYSNFFVTRRFSAELGLGTSG